MLGARLLITRRALAHEAHYETESAEPTEDQADGEQSAPQSEPAAAEEVTPALDKTDSNTNAEPSGDVINKISEDSAEDGTTIQETSATQLSNSTAEASFLEGFSIGLGESLLALIIAGPFVLLSLKRRFHS